MKRKMAAVEAKRTTVIDGLFKSKAYLARIRTLQQEILGPVFLLYGLGPAQSPWTPMQVTWAW
jgi:hypothetical protein